MAENMRKREFWIDDIKVVACILVLLGHLMQSMASAEIISSSAVYLWFNKTIYYFHVPLFFICSGYLYQKFSKINSLKSWENNVIKKLISLGIPYFTFTTLTWLIKYVFSWAGNSEIDNIFVTLFLEPTSPFWYLYALFFVFLVTPTFAGKRSAIVGLGIAIVLKSLTVFGIVQALFDGGGYTQPYALSTLLSNEIWFVLGMCLSIFKITDLHFPKRITGLILAIVFIALSVVCRNIDNSGLSFLLGLLACTVVFLLFMDVDKQSRIMAYLSKYTMPIFLMHSMFAATLRSILLKIGITNAFIHIPLGIVISIFGPILAAWIMHKLKYLEFLLYPGKFIKIKGSSKGDKKTMPTKKLNGTVIVTYRCNARCNMCNRYKKPSKPEEEISIETIKKLPPMYFTNITGGEPFIRTDLPDIVRELYKKSDRIVISTNGFFTDRIVALCKEFPNIGIRISIEGLEETNNKIRGLDNGFQRGYNTLKTLVEMGMKDVGFGMTVQDANAKDLVALYDLSNKMNMEFATASLHNSFYFVEAKNIIHDRPMVAKEFENLVNELLKSNSPKKWFRAYFNHGLINYIYGQKRLLPCDMAFDTFFIDPYGDVMPCNGTKDKEVMGNLNEAPDFETLWNSEQAEGVRKKVRCCDRQCWMIGSVSPAMHKYFLKPAWWVVRHKLKFWTKHKYSMYENKICRDYRDGKVTKEELDKCSTCDLNAVINDGLSDASKEQLKTKTGEEIVDADIANQNSVN